MIFGVDYLGGAKYQKLILQSHPKNLAAGVFWNVDGFGSAKALVQGLAKKETVLIRIQLMWKDGHGFKRSDFPEIVKRAKEVEAIAAKNPKTEFRISGACENKLSRKDAQDLADLCKAAAPHCKYVHCPLSEGVVLADEINEFHGAEKKPRKCKRMQFSFDGTSAVDSNITEVKEDYEEAEVFFIWIPQNNGRKTTKDTTPRPQRKAYPTRELIESQYALIADKGKTTFNGGIYKSHAEQTKNDTAADTRGNRPVIIIPQKVEAIEFVLMNGAVIATAGSRQPFGQNQYRYYSKSYGYQIAKKAVKLQGSPIVRLRAAGKDLDTINPSFRDGKYK